MGCAVAGDGTRSIFDFIEDKFSVLPNHELAYTAMPSNLDIAVPSRKRMRQRSLNRTTPVFLLSAVLRVGAVPPSPVLPA